MRVVIDELEVLFPYSYIYPEQFRYMQSLKLALDRGGPCLLEMPSGTGKTVSLLSLLAAYMMEYPDRLAKIVYCSRTVSEISKVVEELKRLLSFRERELGVREPLLCVSLSSRKNLCIHPERPSAVGVNQSQSTLEIDSFCRQLTSSWVREQPESRRCDLFENLMDPEQHAMETVFRGVYSLEDVREMAGSKRWCPYFLARQLVDRAQIVIFSYQYMIDPKISHVVSRDFPSNSAIVFDEAHNIDNACIEALSVRVTRKDLQNCEVRLQTLHQQMQHRTTMDPASLQADFRQLMSTVASPDISDELAQPTVPSQEEVEQLLPGNIRKANHFLLLLTVVVGALITCFQHIDSTETPRSFRHTLLNSTSDLQTLRIDANTLRFFSTRTHSLLRTLEVWDTLFYSPLLLVSDFLTLLGTYNDGFVILKMDMAEGMTEPTYQFCCLDASLALTPVLQKYHSVVITSGTMSPLDMFQKMLLPNFTPPVAERLEMTMNRPCVCPLVVTKGSDQVPISSRYDEREDRAVVRNYGNLLIELSAVVPDGIVCFFTSYQFMEKIVEEWNEMGILASIMKHKLLFVETADTMETSVALSYYRKACDSGRGAVLFSVARGKVSEGIDFDHHYGRCVVVYGVPFVDTRNAVLLERMDYLQKKYNVKENDFFNFDAMRTAAQCVGRVIRGKSDYGVMIFADRRYTRRDKRDKLPQWISQHLTGPVLNLSTDVAVGYVKNFLKEMSQPTDVSSELGVSLLTEEHLQERQRALNARRAQRRQLLDEEDVMMADS